MAGLDPAIQTTAPRGVGGDFSKAVAPRRLWFLILPGGDALLTTLVLWRGGVFSIRFGAS
jgi:hypothetical protein